MTEKPKRSRVALVVFADVDPGWGDPENIAAWAIKRALGAERGAFKGDPVTVQVNGQDVGVIFHDVIEVGMAAGNGYLWTHVTPKVFRQWSWQFDGEQVDE